MLPFLFRQFRKLETKVHELNYLFWECTQRCNLSCRHCGSDCFASSKDKDMPMEDFLKALDTIPNPIHQNKPPKHKSSKGLKYNTERLIVVITGGEPLLRPDLVQIGEEITKRGYYWSIVSNGYLYTKENHRKLMQAGLRALTISLDGIEEDHNWMRGNPNSYQRTIEAIQVAASDKLLDFDVVSCINRRTINYLEDMYRLLLSLGVKKWRIFTIIPIGRAVQEPELHLTNHEMVKLMDFIQQKRELNRKADIDSKQTMEVAFSCEGYLGKYEEKVRPVRFFCHAGINIASVLIDGRICACPNIDRDAFSQGNIYRDNLYEIWQNKFGAFRNRNWARKSICSECRQFKNCMGGGMHNWHGKLSAPLSCHYHRTLADKTTE